MAAPYTFVPTSTPHECAIVAALPVTNRKPAILRAQIHQELIVHFPTSNRQAAIPVPQSPESAAKELPTAVVTVREPGAQYTIELNKDGLHLSFSDWSDEDRDEEHGETTYAAMDVPGLVSKYAAFREVHSIPLADLPQMLVQDYSRRGFFNYDRMIRHLDKLHQTPTGSQRL